MGGGAGGELRNEPVLPICSENFLSHRMPSPAPRYVNAGTALQTLHKWKRRPGGRDRGTARDTDRVEGCVEL